MRASPRPAENRADSARDGKPQPTACIDVIIPVYAGADETQRCIASVLAVKPRHPHEILVINDGSPEPELVAWLQALANRGAITLLHNAKNQGFVATVNRGMALHPDRDVVLLNSDTEVAGNWLDRLLRAAYAAPNIGTVTPFSNNATICSYPRFCQDNPLPAGLSVAALDALFAQTNPGCSVDIPTAVGFCMYIRRACLAETGLFSVEHFGKGYGEENDFCMRATRLGFRHVLAADTFVYHRGGVSFADTSDGRKRQAQAMMERLHPDYSARVHRHIERDPARPLRIAVDAKRLQTDPRPTILAITHGLGGGTDKHVEELAQALSQQANFLILAPTADEGIEVRWASADGQLRLYFKEREQGALLTWLRSVGVDRVHLHHTKSLPRRLWSLADELGVPLDFTAHDYYTFCPQVSLTSAQGRYCGEPDESGCTRCLEATPAPGRVEIQTWRGEYQALLARAERIFCPSQDCAERLRSRFPSPRIAPRILATPHPDLDGIVLPPALPQPLFDRPLRVAVLGKLTRIKGADLLDETARWARNTGAPLEFHLIGESYRLLSRPPRSSLRVHGRYDDAELLPKLAELAPDLVWFPAQAPETYSFTLSACLRAGLPVVAPNLGSFPERLHRRAWTFVEPWDRSPQAWCEFFVAISRRHFAPGVPPPLPEFPARYDDFAYGRDYLAPLGARPLRAAGDSCLSPEFFAHHARPPRPPLSRQTLKRVALAQVNRLKSVRLFRQAIETIPQPLRTRAYRWLAGARA
jgi:GT2 family glycosyltransferase/glycosyltransferase involved in cell wall biosynthesis